MQHDTCTGCSAQLPAQTGRRSTWCSDRCRYRAKHGISNTQTWTCIGCGAHCERPPARGQRPKWCDDCRAKALRERFCPTCGKLGVRSDSTYCSAACKPEYLKPQRIGAQAELALPFAVDRRSPIRKAVESGTTADVIQAVKRDVKVDPDTGCWNWQRTTRDGYATVNLGKQTKYVHRLVMGDPGSPVVHHACANRACVNPDHLQLVTNRENVAEMLERTYYLRRIDTLEAALQAIDPEHPALS